MVTNRQLVEDTYETIFTHDQRFPLWATSINGCLLNGFWIKEPWIYEKSKMISMIASNKNMCEGHRLRLEWVDGLVIRLISMVVDLMRLQIKRMVFAGHYMFSVAIENGQGRNIFY